MTSGTFRIGCINMHLSRLDKRRDFYAFICNTVQIDICVVSETRFQEGQGGGKMEEVIDQEIFQWFGRERKQQRLKSGEGGVGILFRKSVGKVEVAKISNLFDILWVRIETCGEILFLAAVYMSPLNTSRETDAAEFLLELENDVLNFRELGKVVVMGDLNSRVGNLPSSFFINEQQYNFRRVSEDVKISKQVAKQGQRILESMNSNKMVIMNGVDGGGEKTCINRNSKGSSMIDYIIMSYDLILYNPEIEGEEEVGRDYKHKNIQNREIEIDLQNLDEQIPNRLIYKRGSIKVWNEFVSVISDHYLVTCDLLVPEKKHKVEENKETKSEIKSKLNTEMEERENGHCVGQVSTESGGRSAGMEARDR